MVFPPSTFRGRGAPIGHLATQSFYCTLISRVNTLDDLFTATTKKFAGHVDNIDHLYYLFYGDFALLRFHLYVYDRPT
jgi:hypothetical protein